MMRDILFDALEYVDDDLLSEVDALRMKKKTNPIQPWMKWMSMAACLCFIIGSVWFVSRYGTNDMDMEADRSDAIEQEKADGADLVHTISSIRVTASGKELSSVTDAPRVTEVYDLLQSFYRDESSPTEQEDGKTSFEAEDNAQVENAGGVPTEYRITLISVDNTEVLYTLQGNTLEDKETGEELFLTNEQVKQLKDTLGIK